MHGPYLEDFSSGYAITTLFVEPRDVDVPVTDEIFYYNAATELGYSPLLARVDGDTHIHMKSREDVPDGHMYVPEDLAEDMDNKRIPDQHPILIAKREGANMIYNIVQDKVKHEQS